jgi:hypothetical protein
VNSGARGDGAGALRFRPTAIPKMLWQKRILMIAHKKARRISGPFHFSIVKEADV